MNAKQLSMSFASGVLGGVAGVVLGVVVTLSYLDRTESVDSPATVQFELSTLRDDNSDIAKVVLLQTDQVERINDRVRAIEERLAGKAELLLLNDRK